MSIRIYAKTSRPEFMLNDPHGLEGRELDGYRIELLIGRGAVGLVYRARHLQLGVPRALKFLDPDLVSDTRFLKKFRDEAQALARSESQHIVKVHDLKDSEFGPYIVMEFVEGGTLDDYLRESGQLAWPDVVDILTQVLAALDKAHGAGVIHRDIKPGNIMIVSNGDGPLVKVTDFGLAIVSRMTDETVAIGEEVSGGTPPYMSPEQSRGGMVDERTDIHAVGVLSYLMLTGQKPYWKATLSETLDAIRTEEPPSILSNSKSLPHDLDRVVRKSMAKKPEDRYRSAREMSKALRSIADPAKTERTTTPTSGPAPDPPTRLNNKWVWFSAAGTVAALALVLWFFMPSSAEKLLLIESEPSGARLLVNGQQFGPTPFQIARDRVLAGDDTEAGLRFTASEGLCCLPLDTTMFFPNLDTFLVNVKLQEYGLLSLTSDPDDLEVTVNGEPLGTTPVEERLLPGPKTIVFSRDGQASTRQVIVGSGDSTFVHEEIKSDAIPPEPQTLATLTVNAPQDVTVTVSGQSKKGNSTFSLGGGKQTLSFQHPDYGVHREGLTLIAGRRKSVTIRYVQEVSISTVMDTGEPGPWASIVRDGVTLEQTTPGLIQVTPPGQQISVRKSGFDVSGVMKNDRRQSTNDVFVNVPTLETEEVRLTFELKRTDQ